MTTDKDLVETWRKIADCYESLGNYPIAVAEARRKANELDPPKPEYPDGTVAWVTSQYGGRYLCTWHAENREWCIGGPDGDSAPGKVTKVEPLRVLADDEIAVKRPPFTPSRRASALLVRNGYGQSAAVVESLIDALDAESGDQ